MICEKSLFLFRGENSEHGVAKPFRLNRFYRRIRRRTNRGKRAGTILVDPIPETAE